MANILLVGNWPSDTGYAWWLMEAFWMAIARRYRGQHRILLCYPKVNTVNPQLGEAGIETVEFNFDVEGDSQRLVDFVRQHDIGYLYLTDKKYVSPSYRKLRTAGVKGIIIHDHTPGERTRPTGLKRILKTMASRLPGVTADAYVAVAPLVIDRFLQVACLPASKCYLATNGIDLGKFDTAPKVDIRAELGLSPDTLMLVSCGRATRYKGVHRIIEAAALLITQGHKGRVAFVHCGDGPDLEEFRALVRGTGLEGSFFLLGRRGDVSGILKSCDIAIHASDGEALSLAIIEFMAASLALVLPDSPTVSQTIENRVSGVLYRPGDVTDLAARLTELIAAPDLRAQLGARARQAVEERYNLQSTIAALLQAVGHVIPG
jgi:glycosyltransferase involved in cell wall biosynthesis